DRGLQRNALHPCSDGHSLARRHHTNHTNWRCSTSRRMADARGEENSAAVSFRSPVYAFRTSSEPLSGMGSSSADNDCVNASNHPPRDKRGSRHNSLVFGKLDYATLRIAEVRVGPNRRHDDAATAKFAEHRIAVLHREIHVKIPH